MSQNLAHILDGKILAAQLKENLKAEISSIKHRVGLHPRMVSIIVGNDVAGQSYALSQQKTAQDLGIHYELQTLTANVTQANVLELIDQLNAYTDVHGIIVNKPLPQHLDFSIIINAINTNKDIEGLNIGNLGRLLLGTSNLLPCTPAAAMAHVKSTGINLKGKHAVVIGRSEIVGKPMAMLLLKENVTVTICHSATVDLPQYVRQADIVIAAVGKPLFVQGDWIKQGAIVIDVGINQFEGKIVGDVDFESVKTKAGYLTPVPGGVGPVTSVMLMTNAFEAFKCQIL